MADDIAIMNELQAIRISISNLESKMTNTQKDLQTDIHSIRTEIHTIRADILEFQLKAQQLEDVHTWVSKFKDRLTLSDLEKLREDVAHLKEYKAKSTVVFAIVQFAMATLVAYLTKG